MFSIKFLKGQHSETKIYLPTIVENNSKLSFSSKMLLLENLSNIEIRSTSKLQIPNWLDY